MRVLKSTVLRCINDKAAGDRVLRSTAALFRNRSVLVITIVSWNDSKHSMPLLTVSLRGRLSPGQRKLVSNHTQAMECCHVTMSVKPMISAEKLLALIMMFVRSLQSLHSSSHRLPADKCREPRPSSMGLG